MGRGRWDLALEQKLSCRYGDKESSGAVTAPAALAYAVPLPGTLFQPCSGPAVWGGSGVAWHLLCGACGPRGKLAGVPLASCVRPPAPGLTPSDLSPRLLLPTRHQNGICFAPGRTVSC